LKCQFCGKDPENDPAYAHRIKSATGCFEKACKKGSRKLCITGGKHK